MKASVADLQGLFTSPTPLTSTLRGLLTLIAAAAVYAAFHPLRDQKPNKKSGESGWDKLPSGRARLTMTSSTIGPMSRAHTTPLDGRRHSVGSPLDDRRSTIRPLSIRIGPALELSRVGYVSPASPGVGRRVNQLIGHTCLSTTQIDEANEDGRYR